jgi:hypothetical protein
VRGVPAVALLGWSFHLALPREATGRIAWGALVDTVAVPASEAGLFALLCFGLFGATLCAGALRFHLLMQAADVPSRLGEAVHVFLVAIFFNTVLPGNVVGDGWRVWQGHDRKRKGPAVLGVIALERLLGLQALGVVALCGAPWVPTLAELPGSVYAGLVVVAAGCAFGPFLLLHPVASRTLRGLVDRLPERASRLRRVTIEAGEGLAAVRRDPRRTGLAVGLSFVCQAIPVLAVWALAQALEGEVALPWLAVVVPFVTLAGMLPISVGGTGVRELLFVSLFGRLGMPAASALALGLGTGLVNLLWAAVGLGLFLTDERRGGGRG